MNETWVFPTAERFSPLPQMTHSTIRQCRNPSGFGTVRRVGPGPKGRSAPGIEPRRLYPFLNRTASSEPLVALPAL